MVGFKLVRLELFMVWLGFIGWLVELVGSGRVRLGRLIRTDFGKAELG